MNSFKKKIQVNNKLIGTGQPIYIIAETACAHDGDLKKAEKLIDAAANAKADAVQLQFFSTDHVVVPKHEVYPILKEIEFSYKQWTDLFHFAKNKGIDVFACTYDIPSVEMAVKLNADGIKLNSSDLNNPDVLVEVASSGIPFTLGTGASTMDEIKNGLGIARENGAEAVILMHGVQNFPTQTKDLNIERIELLKNTFNIPVGYHDHTDGYDNFGKIVDLLAIGMGANVIEKHITIDRSEKGIDYQAALEPDEFKIFVENIRKADIAVGSKEIKPFSDSELKYRKFQKKSIVACRDVLMGEKISREKVIFIRNTENGISPIDFNIIEGKKANRNISKFENILTSDVS